MEIRIKTGSDVKCEYTGDGCPVLVRLVADEDPNGVAPKDSGWLGRSALEAALKILDSMEGKTPRVESREEAFRAAIRTAAVDPDAPVGTFTPKVPPDAPAQVQAFAREIANLAANPPKTRDSEKDGLSESHIREVMKKFLPTFRNPMASMYPALQAHVGMPRERFEHLVGMLKNG